MDLQLLVVEVPPGDRTIAYIFPQQHVQCPDDMSHHTVPYHNDFFESAEDLTYLFSRKPAHITAAWDERCIEADATTARVCIEKGIPCWAQRREGHMKIKGGDLTGCVVAIVVVCEGIDDVWYSLYEILWWP